MRDKPMIYLIACYKKEADDYARRSNLKKEEYKVITKADQLRGIRLTETTLIIEVGRYWENKELYKIQDLIKANTR